MDDFLRFTRDMLGLSEAQYDGIIQSRQQRGGAYPYPCTWSSADRLFAFLTAFVPPAQSKAKSSDSKRMAGDDRDVPSNIARAARAPPIRPRQVERNPNLDSFEALMEAMDAELHRQRPPTAKPATGKSRVLVRDADADADEDDFSEGDLDDELAGALKRDPTDDDADGPGHYGLIKNFLESFKSQAGLAGPVSNLAGRLDPTVQLPTEGPEDVEMQSI